MKKKAHLLLIFLLLSVFCGQAQYLRPPKKKTFSMDVGVAQSFMTTNWYGDRAYDELVKSIGGTSVFTKFNLKVYKNFGGWVAIEFMIRGKKMGISDKPDFLNKLDLDYNNYYVNKLHEFSSSNVIEPKLSLGFFYEFEHNKWSFSPSVGMGWHYLDYTDLCYRFKEKGTNQAYVVSFTHEHKHDQMTYLTFQLKANYKLIKNKRLILGVNFSQYLNQNNLSIGVRDYYTNKLISEDKKKSRLINTLGISAGLSF